MFLPLHWRFARQAFEQERGVGAKRPAKGSGASDNMLYRWHARCFAWSRRDRGASAEITDEWKDKERRRMLLRGLVLRCCPGRDVEGKSHSLGERAFGSNVSNRFFKGQLGVV